VTRALVAAGFAALVLLASAGAAGAPQEVNIQFSAYGPSQIDILPGETVSWTNVSLRTHTVTSDTGLFDSGEVQGGGHFTFTFDKVGEYHYHCIIHPSIVGEVDVRPVTLGSLPTAAVPVGAPVDFSGRTATPAVPVSVQSSKDGTTFTTVATATPRPDGTWQATVKAEATGSYRAASGTGVSQSRRLLVGIRKIRVRATPAGVALTVSPSAPYSRFLVEVYLPERFGWWPVSRGTFNYVSEADVRVRRPARVRVVLVDKDGWTPIATSPVIVLPRR
jgi:plastocyanin